MLTYLILNCQILIILVLTCTGAWAHPAETPHAASRIVVVDKARRDLAVYAQGRQVLRFPASFGIDPLSDKTRQFDLATPEGLYFIAYKKTKTRFHRLLGLSYPNPANAQRGLAAGAISPADYHRIVKADQTSRPAPCGTGLGCGIAIHGGGVFRNFGNSRERDWTEGCIALNNPDMEKVFALCRPGDPVLIFNSSRHLYGIIRPFTRINAVDEKGMPYCPEGVCAYEVDIPTALGRTRLTIREGKTYGRSLQVAVSKDQAPHDQALLLIDRNADGYLSPLDTVEGQLVDASSPEAAYAKIRAAVIDALSTGDLSESMVAQHPP